MSVWSVSLSSLLTPRASLKRIAECAGSTATSTALCGVLRLEVLFLSSGSRELWRPPGSYKLCFINDISKLVWSARCSLWVSQSPSLTWFRVCVMSLSSFFISTGGRGTRAGGCVLHQPERIVPPCGALLVLKGDFSRFSMTLRAPPFQPSCSADIFITFWLDSRAGRWFWFIPLFDFTERPEWPVECCLERKE